jgi:acyl phosphate:glycerol-3-phosphate acyltransferase
MEALYSTVLMTVAFWLAACPFAVWIGHKILHLDIRDYGDHNPGAANVFRAGSIKWGFAAVIVEVAKGAPFVLLASLLFKLPDSAIYAVAICAVAGHAFSPFLNFSGGKATAVTFGVLVTLPQKEMLIAFVILMVIGFLILNGDSWRIVLSMSGVLLYTMVTDKGLWAILFVSCLLLIIIFKNYQGLRTMPGRKPKVYIGFHG